MPTTPYKYTEDIRGYQDAVWDFLTEHSEVLPSGAMFIKFHTDGKQNFINRVLSRWQYNYHREDPKAKQAMIAERRNAFDAQRAEKALKLAKEHERRRQVRKRIARVQRINRLRIFITDLFT